MPTLLPPIEIFRRGRQTAADGTVADFSDADLAAAAAAYDPALHQAPLVVGHPTHDAPAYGWITGLDYQCADGLLRGRPDQVDPAFAAAHQAGRLKYHSASFYRPDAPTNPKPGVYYLRHLGFLGAMPPSLKGLQPAQFAESAAADTLTIAFGETERPALAFAPTPIDAPREDLTPMGDTTAEFAERQAALDQQAAALTAREQTIAAREAAASAQAAALHLSGCVAFCEGLAAQGRILPVDQTPLARLLAEAPADDTAAHADFAEADRPQPPAAWLRDWLARLPVQVDYAERSPASPASSAGSADPAARFGAEFDRSPTLQAEFSDRASYIAFKKAEGAGRVTVSTKLTPGS